MRTMYIWYIFEINYRQQSITIRNHFPFCNEKQTMYTEMCLYFNPLLPILRAQLGTYGKISTIKLERIMGKNSFERHIYEWVDEMILSLYIS